MKTKFNALSLMLSAALFVFMQPVLAAEPWKELFDGKSLDGWTQKGGSARYAVEDGQIVGTTVLDTANSFL